MVRLLYGLQSVFSLWMLVDATQRGAARYWYPIIFLPGGPFAYFVMVKLHDREFSALHQFFDRLLKPKVTLETLRHRAGETPSFVNKLALAEGLFDAGLHQEAAACFEAVLQVDDESKDALYGYALCQLELGGHDRAIHALQRLIEIKPSFHDYDGWILLALALSKSEQLKAAVVVMDELVQKAPWLPHRVAYAGYLWKDHQHEKAREQLQLGLKNHEHSPRFQRKREAVAAKKARTMLLHLE